LPARAQTQPIALEWKAPADCPTQDAVLGEVARVLGHVPVGAPVRSRADVARADNGRWQAQLALATTGAQSQRLLVAESCEAIASATALIVAVAIEGGITPNSPERGSTPKLPEGGSTPKVPAGRATGRPLE
jgi:hypothetical protein